MPAGHFLPEAQYIVSLGYDEHLEIALKSGERVKFLKDGTGFIIEKAKRTIVALPGSSQSGSIWPPLRSFVGDN